MLDDLKIRNKLILLVAGPIVIIVVLSAIGARSRQASADDSRRVEQLVAVAQADSDVVDALQQEAIYSTAYVGSGRKAWEKDMGTARQNTDTVVAAALARFDGASGSSGGFRTTSGLARGAAEKLTYIRGAVDQGYEWDQVVSTYGAVQDTFLAVNDAVASAMDDPRAAGQLRTASALASYKSAQAEQGALLTGAAQGGSFDEATFDLFTTALDAETSQEGIFASIADTPRKQAVLDALASDAHLSLETATRTALEAGTGDLALDGDAMAADTGAVIKDLHGVEANLFGRLISDTQANRSDAERSANLFLIAALIGILGAAAAAVLLGRRITRPLRHLTDAADRLSTEQMPRLIETLKNPSEDEIGFQIGAMRPIEISSTDEIGQLARSFNEVQRVAGEVAAEQATLLRKGIGEMFVNLARRNQALLDRQIEFIDELERGEEDPDQLENLYRLDHLATRMRRNAESLLVLAGAEPPRRRGRPAPLANVVRAALAEVEDFGRIELLSFDEVLVASNAAADLAHLLSELMENATNFSPPETRVEVVGHRTKADGYVISITDHGIGMSSDQIVEANESLAKPPLVGLAMSRSLGFIVVGRLATRHGIAVRMMPSASGGVTAVVSIAPSLVVDTPGGSLAPEPQAEVPARLKPVMESSGSSLGPLEFTPRDAPADDLPDESPLAPVAWDQALAELTPSLAGPSLAKPAVAEPEPAGTEPLAVPAAFFEDAAPTATPASSMPEALTFAPPTPPPPAAAGPEAPGHQESRGVPLNRPFFLEDAQPPRPFGAEGPPVPAPAAPEAAPATATGLFGGEVSTTPAPTGPSAKAAPTPADEPPRLFGGPKPTPPASPSEPPLRSAAPVTADGPPPAAPPLATRRPAAAAAPTPPRIPGQAAPLASRTPAAAPPAEAEAEAAGAPAAPATTTTGLAKRVPRAAGASRAIPGAEVERNVSATRRSPEEIRKMLSQHSAGRQRARVEESVPAGAPEEREAHE